MHDPYDDFDTREIAFERAENADAIEHTAPTAKIAQNAVYGRLRAVDELLESCRASAAAARELNAQLTARHNPVMLLAIIAPAWKRMDEDE